MATATSTKSVTVTKTVTEMVPVTKEVQTTETKQVSSMNLNFRNGENRVFDPAAFADLVNTMKSNGVAFTIRVKATKDVSIADKKALVSLNNLLIRMGKAAGVSARKDKPSTPTGACNNCTACVS